MKPTQHKYKILCYGDSNTWGYLPGSGGKRHPTEKIWPSLLQERLGDDYLVINEGLNSRTANIDDPDKPGRNGLTSLAGIINKHKRVDMVILFLGTNDLKSKFNRTPEDIAKGAEQLIEKAKELTDGKTEILLLCPPIVNEKIKSTQEKYSGAEAKSKALPALYESIAKKYKIKYLNLQDSVQPSEKDGYHLDEGGHEEIAKVLFNIVQVI